MRSIYKRFLQSVNLVVEAPSISASINSAQQDSLNKMQFLTRVESDASHAIQGGEPLSSVYSVKEDELSGVGEYFIPVLLTWNDIVRFSSHNGMCRLAVNTRVAKANGLHYSEAATISTEQLHRAMLKVEAISQDGVEWYALDGKNIVDASTLSEHVFRLPWLAKRNANLWSLVDAAELSMTEVILYSNGEASFQLDDKIVEGVCPDYVINNNKRVIVCNKGLILRSKNPPPFLSL